MLPDSRHRKNKTKQKNNKRPNAAYAEIKEKCINLRTALDLEIHLYESLIYRL